LSSEYESESETSIGFALFLATPPSPLLPTFRMSQHDYPTIIRQLQEQLATQQAQIQTLLEGGAVVRRGVREGPKRTANLDVVKPQLFDGASSKVLGFVIGCKLYIRNKLAGATVEEQVQWVLSHVQGGLANI